MEPASRADLTWPVPQALGGASRRGGGTSPQPGGAGPMSGPGAPQAPAAPRDAAAVLGAFERLFVREYPRVVAAAYRVLGDRQAAEDAAQEAFVAYQHRYAAEAPFAAAWLHAAAVHGALNQLRSERRRRQREGDPAASAPAVAGMDGRPDTADPAHLVEAAETRREVRRALARIAPRSAAVLVLRYSGLSYAEVAAALGVPINQVGTLLRRAEATLRKELHDAPHR